MRTFTAVLIILSLSAPAFAQDQSQYPIAAIKNGYMYVGQKPYKMLGKCPTFQVGDMITFSENPITCDTVTAIDTDGLTTCNLVCLDNLDAPDPD